jgi:hypothetical protein
MQAFSLGDYRGNRDTLNAALAQDNPTLQGAMGMASGMAQQGLAGESKRLSMRQAEADSLSKALAIKDFEARMLSEAGDEETALKEMEAADKEQAFADEMGGRESAMLDWSNNVLQSYAPDSPEYKQAVRTIKMLSDRQRKGTAYDKGYMDYVEEYGINDPISQGTLGSLGVQYEGGGDKPAKDKKPAPKKRSGVDSEYDDDVENS